MAKRAIGATKVLSIAVVAPGNKPGCVGECRDVKTILLRSIKLL